MSFIDAHDFSAGLVLRVLGIASSTYYDWRARRVCPSQRQRDDADLLERIEKIRGSHEFAPTYGARGCGSNYATKGWPAPANASSGSCGSTACKERTCARAGRAARPGRTLATRPRRTWSIATSTRRRRTSCGSPT